MSLVETGPTGSSPTSTVLQSAGLPPAEVARASFDDGSFLLAVEPVSLDNCLCPVELSAQHFSASGASLAAAVKVGPIYPGSHLALAGLSSTALIATTGSLAGPVTLRQLDEDGNLVGSPQPLGAALDGGGPGVLGIDIAPYRSGAIVAWSQGLPNQTRRAAARAGRERHGSAGREPGRSRRHGRGTRRADCGHGLRGARRVGRTAGADGAGWDGVRGGASVLSLGVPLGPRSRLAPCSCVL